MSELTLKAGAGLPSTRAAARSCQHMKILEGSELSFYRDTASMNLPL